MKDLGLNPTESEIQDLINEVERNGYIYYPAFCKIIMRKFREEPEEAFRQELFRTLVGSKDYPEGTVAPLYNINKEQLTYEQFKYVMTNLPDYVSEADCKKMYRHADKDDNGSISYKEFTLMCNVPKSEAIPTKMPTTPTSKTDTAATTVVNGGAKGIIDIFIVTNFKDIYDLGRFQHSIIIYNDFVGKAVTTVTTKPNALPNATTSTATGSMAPVETIVSVSKSNTATAT